MAKYALLFKGGKANDNLAKEYFDRFMDWAKEISNGRINGSRFKQEGMVVSGEKGEIASGITFGSDTVGGYLIIDADNYDEAVGLARHCPIFENGGKVEIRELLA